MFKPLIAFSACLTLFGLAACSQRGTSELLNDAPSTQTAHANPDLTMPPDLRLPQPGSAPEAAQAPASLSAPVTPKRNVSAAPVSPVTGAPDAQPQGDIYDQYGISKTNPDGTQKTGDQLREELRKAVIAKKRQQNPNYGTIKNIGSVFNDG